MHQVKLKFTFFWRKRRLKFTKNLLGKSPYVVIKQAMRVVRVHNLEGNNSKSTAAFVLKFRVLILDAFKGRMKQKTFFLCRRVLISIFT